MPLERRYMTMHNGYLALHRHTRHAIPCSVSYKHTEALWGQMNSGRYTSRATKVVALDFGGQDLCHLFFRSFGLGGRPSPARQ
jgi:hypothetical protein